MRRPRTNAVRPRQLGHRGVVTASAFLLDVSLLGLDEARRRVLLLWTPGARIYQVPQGLLVRLSATVRVACDRAPGWPLVPRSTAVGAPLAGAPLTDDEWQTLAPPPGSCILVQGGQAVVLSTSEEQRQDPATWLDLGALLPVETTSLGAVAPPVVVAEKPTFDPRAQLQDIPGASPELAGILDALRKAGEAAERQRQARGIGGLGGGFSFEFSPAPWLQRALSRLLGRQKQEGAYAPPPVPRQSGGLADRARWLAFQALLRSGLVNAAGRRQAEYIGRMMQMFDRGDLAEALRHAIPLGGGIGEGFSLPFLGLFGPRPDLRISPGLAAAGGTLFDGPDLFSRLEALYRAAYERLAAAGRIDEAAFVLAELLQASEEAVAFLERHGRLRLAAEMAEARELPPGLVVRQWFVAGHRERAVWVARRTGAFADAVLRMERSDAEQGKVLRLLWADSLASTGDYPTAVEVAWPVMEARHVALEWVERSLRIGGVTGARMLARKLSYAPDEADVVRGQAIELLEGEGAEDAPARLAFAQEMHDGESTPVTIALGRAALRAVLRDAAQGHVERTPAQLRTLAHQTGDTAIRVDLPNVTPPARTPLHALIEPLDFTIAAEDVGTLPLYDAAFLPGGRCVVALGEAGVRLLSREGRTVAHWDQPTHRLVVSDHGDRALALAPRGDVQRLARLDFATLRAEDWCEAPVGAWAPDYDGSLWYVASGKGFLAIDATAKAFQALWRTADVGGTATCIARTRTHCSLLVRAERVTDHWGRPSEPTVEWERWAYDLPFLALRFRTAMPAPPGVMGLLRAVSPEGRVADLTAEQVGEVVPGQPESSEIGIRLAVDGAATGLHLVGELTGWFPPVLTSQWAAMAIHAPEGCGCSLLDLKQGQLRAHLALANASRVSYRLTPEHLTLTDNLGRLLVLDLNTGALLRNLRIT